MNFVGLSVGTLSIIMNSSNEMLSTSCGNNAKHLVDID